MTHAERRELDHITRETVYSLQRALDLATELKETASDIDNAQLYTEFAESIIKGLGTWQSLAVTLLTLTA